MNDSGITDIANGTVTNSCVLQSTYYRTDMEFGNKTRQKTCHGCRYLCGWLKVPTVDVARYGNGLRALSPRENNYHLHVFQYFRVSKIKEASTANSLVNDKNDQFCIKRGGGLNTSKGTRRRSTICYCRHYRRKGGSSDCCIPPHCALCIYIVTSSCSTSVVQL